jgi:hypothetical protein
MYNQTFSTLPSGITELDNSFRFEQNWFFPQTKEVISLYTRFKDSQVFPIMVKLDLNSLDYTQIFPLFQDDINNIISSLSGNIDIGEVTKGAVTYNSTIKKYLITYVGVDKNTIQPQPFVVNFNVTNWDLPRLESIDIYKDTTSFKPINTPPLILDVNRSLVFQNVSTNTLFVSSVSILGNPISVGTTDNYTGGTVSVSVDGTITAMIPESGTYHVGISASNEVGTSYCAATFVVN